MRMPYSDAELIEIVKQVAAACGDPPPLPPGYVYGYGPEDLPPPEPTFPTVEKALCPRCGAPAYVGLIFVECSRKDCQ